MPGGGSSGSVLWSSTWPPPTITASSAMVNSPLSCARVGVSWVLFSCVIVCLLLPVVADYIRMGLAFSTTPLLPPVPGGGPSPPPTTRANSVAVSSVGSGAGVGVSWVLLSWVLLSWVIVCLLSLGGAAQRLVERNRFHRFIQCR